MPGRDGDLVTAVADGTMILSASRRTLTIDAGAVETQFQAGEGRRFDEALADPPFVVAVAEDDHEERPARVIVIDLRDGKVRDLSSGRTPATTHGGSWSVGEGQVAYPTYQGRKYCIALADLRTLAGEVVHCAERRHGLTQFSLTSAGLSFMGFDDSLPSSCRVAAVLVPGGRAEVLDGPTKCKPWDVVVLDEGVAVWAEVLAETEIEVSEVYVRGPDGAVLRLGTAATGTLTPCGDAVYFVRDPESKGQPARLLRYRGGTDLHVVHAPAVMNTVLGPPRCAGDTISITAYAPDTTSTHLATTA